MKERSPVAYFKDLTPYSYSPGEEGLLSVGWLAKPQRFQKGRVDEAIWSKVGWLCLHEPVAQTRGYQGCEFCRRRQSLPFYLLVDGEDPHLLGSNEIRVPGDGVAYASPSLVLHYLTAHRYKPPDEFLDAASKLPNALPAGWRVEKLTWKQRERLQERE